jgi:hypothetical protein
LLECASFDGDPIGYAHLLRRISFDCHPVSPFSHIRDARCYCTSLSSPSDTTPSLLRKPLMFRQHSLSLLRRSLALSLSLEVPTGLPCLPPPAARALSSESRRCSRSASRVHDAPLRLSTVLRDVTAAATPPPILLLGRAHLESPRQGGN